MGHVNEYEKAKHTGIYNGSSGAQQAWDERVKADEVNERIARSRKQKTIASFLGASVIIFGFGNIYKNISSLAPNGTVQGAVFPAPLTDKTPEQAMKVLENKIPGDYSTEAVRGCDKPAARAMQEVVKCHAILPYEKLVLTTDPDVANEYRAVQYDSSQKIIWKGYVSKESYFKQTYSTKVAPGVPRVVVRTRLMPGAQIKVGNAFGAFFPYVNNKAPSDLSAQPENRKAFVARNQIPGQGAKVELYNCDRSIGLCDAGIPTPGGWLYGIIRQEDVRDTHVGQYGKNTATQPALRGRPVTSSGPAPRF